MEEMFKAIIERLTTPTWEVLINVSTDGDIHKILWNEEEKVYIHKTYLSRQNVDVVKEILVMPNKNEASVKAVTWYSSLKAIEEVKRLTNKI